METKEISETERKKTKEKTSVDIALGYTSTVDRK